MCACGYGCSLHIACRFSLKRFAWDIIIVKLFVVITVATIAGAALVSISSYIIFEAAPQKQYALSNSKTNYNDNENNHRASTTATIVTKHVIIYLVHFFELL